MFIYDYFNFVCSLWGQMLEARSQGGRQEYSAGKQGVRNLYRSTLFLHCLFIHSQSDCYIIIVWNGSQRQHRSSLLFML
jgi:hypothetical protein